MDPLSMSASAYSLSPSHFIPNPQIQDLSLAESFSQPDSPSNSSLFELFTNTDATVLTSNSTLADEKDHIRSTPNPTLAPTSSTTATATTTSVTTPTPISAPVPAPTPTPAPVSAPPAPAPPAPIPVSQATSSIPTTSAATTATTTPATTFNTALNNVFSPNSNQFFTTAPSPAFNSSSSGSNNAPAKPTFSSAAAKPAFTPRTINPIATTQGGPFRVSKARARHKQRLKAYRTRRKIEHLDTPYIHIPGDPVPPTPPTAIRMYSDARLTLAQVCWARLTPMQEITRLYFHAYHDSETTSWGGRTGDLLSEERKRFKDEYLEHVHTFIPQVEALRGFIELGRKDIGQFRTDFLLKGVGAMLCYMKEMKGQRAKEPLKEDDMLMLHKMFGQFGNILNSEFQIKWKFNKERLVGGGGLEMDEYK
ncbi:hypothetical protein MKZ38_007981 [Zalerion maritima]|uniref:Uncharacterized protein n=1 Tax=Zalerion maritima TaxID=339359 RepID=A0AAD5RH65_9PEZI|nr:hypothetical protein MKZ38_007981 [Zalerion maritima]